MLCTDIEWNGARNQQQKGNWKSPRFWKLSNIHSQWVKEEITLDIRK